MAPRLFRQPLFRTQIPLPGLLRLPTLLAIDTATDALSLALQRGDERRAWHRVMPRQQHQQVFAALGELLGGEAPAHIGLEGLVFGRGPGSFTGLRIAASVVQGLAFSLDLPVIGISTLETQARSYLRRSGRLEPCLILSTIDARIGQVYGAFFAFDGLDLSACGEAFVAPPEAIDARCVRDDLAKGRLIGVGSGCRLADAFPPDLAHLDARGADSFPEAEDMLDVAAQRLAAGQGEAAETAVPDYVQRRIGWKTLAEQGRRA
jgi:tRNA threonylcarbamoyladenosine biosynthesis protein TsaB